MRNRNKNKAKVLGAFIAGAAAASAAGMYYLYGPKGKEHRKRVEGWTLRAKGEIMEKMENTKEMTEDKYHKIVDSVLKKYSKAKNVGEMKARKFAKELKEQWNEIKEEAEDAANNKKVIRARRRVARKIDPDK